MLDIQYIRENPETVKRTSQQKGYNIDVAHLLELDSKRRQLIQKSDELRAQLNKASEDFKNQPPSEEQRASLKQIKEQLVVLEDQQEQIDKVFTPLLRSVPNVFSDDTPTGGEEANREEKKWGEISDKNFEIKDHLTWLQQKGLVDFERGAKVAGNKFYFLIGPMVELELAVFQMALTLAKKHNFTAMTVPHLVNTRILEGAGFSARGDEKQIYKIENDDLNLIATSEIPLTGFHADEILDEKELPRLYAGLSPAYRMESGAYGKHNRGLFRTHQFNKLELYVFCKPEDSELLHQKLINFEEELCQVLEIPYRIVRIAAGDLGAPAYKKYDIEYWSPVDKTYRELMSCSNVTDYQARRLNIRFRSENGTNFVHTLNGTAAAMSRIPIALIENHQQSDGSLLLPKALRSVMGEGLI